MQTQAVKLDNGWFIKDLPGFEDIKRDVINVDVLLIDQELPELDYKEIRGIAIMERYFEKQQRETRDPNHKSDSQVQFRQQFGIKTTAFSVAIKEL